MSTPLRLAIVGTGGIARYHLNNLKRMGGTEIAGLCDVELPRAEALAKEFGGRAYAGVDPLLDTEKPDALLVCTPPFVRLAPIQSACARKIPLFCEKPPAFSLEDAAQVQAALDASGVLHSVGFMYRHKETTDRARELLEGQTVLAIQSTFVNGPLLSPDFPAWFKLQEKSGGPLLDQAIHLLDLLRYLFGDLETIFALGSNRASTRSAEVTIHDTLNLALAFQSGLGGTHIHSWASEPARIRIEILCRTGNVTLDLRENLLTGKLRGLQFEFKPADDCYVTELERFFQAVRTQDPAPIRSTYRDAVKTLAACCAANRSAISGRPEACESAAGTP